MTATALRPYQEKALKTLDGVIKIAANEMLVQGEYVTATVADKELAQAGAICGGHQACLVGSTYIAYGVKPWKIESPRERQRIFEIYARGNFMARRPGLKLAYEALNVAAFRVIKREHPDSIELITYGGEITEPSQGWGEYFFEVVLEGRTHNTIREEVTRVARNAKRLIKMGVVS